MFNRNKIVNSIPANVTNELKEYIESYLSPKPIEPIESVSNEEFKDSDVRFSIAHESFYEDIDTSQKYQSSRDRIEARYDNIVNPTTGKTIISGEQIAEYFKAQKKAAFKNMLFSLIDSKSLTDSHVYKKANVSRKVFSKIRCDENYKPSKNTVCALGLSLRLDIFTFEELLDTVGFSLSYSIERDLIIRYCFESEIYDVNTVNCLLSSYNEPPLTE